MSTWVSLSLLVTAFLAACWLVGVYNRLTASRRDALAAQALMLEHLHGLVVDAPHPADFKEISPEQARMRAAWAQLLRLAGPASPTLLYPTQCQAMDAAWGIWRDMLPGQAWTQANEAAALLAKQAHQRYVQHVDAYNRQRDLWPARVAAWLFGFRRAGVARALLDNELGS